MDWANNSLPTPLSPVIKKVKGTVSVLLSGADFLFDRFACPHDIIEGIFCSEPHDFPGALDILLAGMGELDHPRHFASFINHGIHVVRDQFGFFCPSVDSMRISQSITSSPFFEHIHHFQAAAVVFHRMNLCTDVSDHIIDVATQSVF